MADRGRIPCGPTFHRHPRQGNSIATMQASDQTLSLAPAVLAKPPCLNASHDVNHDDYVPLRSHGVDRCWEMLRTQYSHNMHELCDELNMVNTKEPTTFVEAECEPSWCAAMIEVLQSIQDNMMWDVLNLLPKHRAIDLKWVLKAKWDENGLVIKHMARIVAKGYVHAVQQGRINFDEVFAPVAHIESIRLIFTVPTHLEWYIQHMDFKSNISPWSAESVEALQGHCHINVAFFPSILRHWNELDVEGLEAAGILLQAAAPPLGRRRMHAQVTATTPPLLEPLSHPLLPEPLSHPYPLHVDGKKAGDRGRTVLIQPVPLPTLNAVEQESASTLPGYQQWLPFLDATLMRTSYTGARSGLARRRQPLFMIGQLAELPVAAVVALFAGCHLTNKNDHAQPGHVSAPGFHLPRKPPKPRYRAPADPAW
uniref:Reverse transcriptase Ty1/copia-type domain-containing protein n=1 Tax=Oryza brachyantha TaxID=4533 RepID=J3MVW8_ORYBR